jgi:hypothetical protein
VDTPSTGPIRPLLLAAVVTLATLALLLTTLGDPGITWDEGITIRRAQRIGAWFAELVEPHELPNRAAAFHADVIVNRDKPHDLSASYWPFVWVLEGHPPMYAVLVEAGWKVSHSWLGPLGAYRFGPALLFSVTAGIVFLSFACWYDERAAWTATAALVFLPRMFAHAHFASYDVPVLCFWVLATLAFLKAGGRAGGTGDTAPERRSSRLWPEPQAPRSPWCWTLTFGVLLGLAFLTKFTGWLAVVPLAVWSLAYRDRRALAVLGAGGLLAVVLFVLLNPPLWHAPIEGLQTFFVKNLYRGDDETLNISGRFFGKNYDLNDPLPWYNTLVWVGVTLPAGTLVLVLAGIARVGWGRFHDRIGTMMLLSSGLLLVVRALPGSPPHDGIRLFLASFAFLACLAGIGVARRRVECGAADEPGRVRQARSRGSAPLPRWAVPAGIALLLSGSAFSTWYYHPNQLSHYNLLIGGLPGAVRAGMEPTYYWDGLTDEALAWINSNTPPGSKVLFSSYDLSSKEGWHLLRQWGRLQPRVSPLEPGEAQWYVLQLRPSAYRPYDAWLVDHAKPVYVKRLHDPPLLRFGPYRLDVPLIAIYDYQDLRRALAATPTNPIVP